MPSCDQRRTEQEPQIVADGLLVSPTKEDRGRKVLRGVSIL
jgi:hypothetical protein